MSLRAALHQVRETDEWLSEQSGLPIAARGLEAVIAGGFLGMERGDWVFPGLRERAGGVLKGCSRERLVDPSKGARPYRIRPVTSSPAARPPHPRRLALGWRLPGANLVRCRRGRPLRRQVAGRRLAWLRSLSS